MHILDTSGTFMGGLAVLARDAGHTVVTGLAGIYPSMTAEFEAQGIRLMESYGAEQIDLAPDLFVIGNVIPRGNPLMKAILDRGLPYVSGLQWLGEHVLAGKWVLAVACTHGKTTTSSILAWLLEDADPNPGFLIGGLPLNLGVSGWLTDSTFSVIEAVEYDTVFFDKRSKFVHYRPRTAVFNNLKYDDVDIRPDLASIETQFHYLVYTVPRVGQIVSNGREIALERILSRPCWSQVERFGVEGDWQVLPAEDGVPVNERFAVHWHGAPIGEVEWTVQSQHNRQNTLAAVAAPRSLGAPPAQAACSFSAFRNVKRHMEIRGSINGVTVYDGLRRFRLPPNRDRDNHHRPARTCALAVLEPRSNIMKLGTMKAQLPGRLAHADLVFGSGAASRHVALGSSLANVLLPLGTRAQALDDLKALVKAVTAVARPGDPGDQILLMSNGGFGGIHQKLLDARAAPQGGGA